MRVHNRVCNRTTWFICTALLVLGACTAEAGQEGSLFYYSDGEKIELVPAQWVAARYVTETAPDLTARIPGFKPIEVRELPIQGLILYRLHPEVRASIKSSVAAELRAMTEVELVAPVFRAPGALVIVTEQFIAQFAPGVSPEAIEALHREHGVEVIEQVPWSERTYLLEVPEGDCLQIANQYHENPLSEYAHPDFVQVMDRRPVPNNSPNERRVYLDGKLLPSDFQIEKGTNRYLVTQPQALVLPDGRSDSESREPSAPVSRVTLKQEGFEGSFPNDWALYGAPTWDDETHRHYAGNWSGYCVGSSVAPPGPYPPNANSWMVYGPFSLSNADDARVALQAWIKSEGGYDSLGIYASVNNSDYYGFGLSGNWASASGSSGWMNIHFDLTRVYTLGDLRGKGNVWIALVFTSDGTQQFEGAYVDDVVIEKITGGYDNLTSDQFDHLQWSLKNTEQLWGVNGADTRAFRAWDVSYGSEAVKIAIIDEGVDLNHPDLASRLVGGYDATGRGSGGAPSGDDAHGTGCAGIAGAVTGNNKGIAGVDRKARITPVRIAYGDGSGGWVTTTSWTADGISWAANHGADVLSNSWGGGSPASAVTNAIAAARSGGRDGKGAVVVFSAGNENTNSVSYPANLSATLAVGATSPCDQRKAPTSCDGEFWWGSSYGSALDLTAPGVFIYTTDIRGSAGYASGDYIYNFNGTSSAAPIVAGTAALILSINPELTASQVEQILTSSAQDLGKKGWDSETGWGRVNTYKAVLETPTPPPTTDLEAVSVYFRTKRGAGSLVPDPVEGQEVYPHFDFAIVADSDITGTLTEIELDGTTLCTHNTTLGAGSYTRRCNTPWTATVGPHELEGRVDPNGEFEEIDETNNVTSRDYTVDVIDEIFADGFESGNTSAWSATVN